MKHNTFAEDQKNHRPVTAPSSTAAEVKESEANFTPSADEVARAAYFTYLNHGSLPGHDVQHWLAAEAHLLAERNRTRAHGFHNKT